MRNVETFVEKYTGGGLHFIHSIDEIFAIHAYYNYHNACTCERQSERLLHFVVDNRDIGYEIRYHDRVVWSGHVPVIHPFAIVISICF